MMPMNDKPDSAPMEAETKNPGMKHAYDDEATLKGRKFVEEKY